jgi:hypothetical protein
MLYDNTGGVSWDSLRSVWLGMAGEVLFAPLVNLNQLTSGEPFGKPSLLGCIVDIIDLF